jgi:hypothetical protein
MKVKLVMILAIASLVLTACASGKTSPSSAGKLLPTTTPSLPAPEPAENLVSDSLSIPIQAEVDQQGAIEVSITPEEIVSAANTLNFDVALNTHSVDLSMDLAELAFLRTDSGVSVQATKWDAPLGGHHVSGTLVFPAENSGKSILDGATSITIVIQNLDAPERVFTWNLGG